MNSNKPYLVKAIYQWIIDNKQTPYVVIDSSYPDVVVPVTYVKNNSITLNISATACSNFVINNDIIKFSASFAGQVSNIKFSPEAIITIYSYESGEGMKFNVTIPPHTEEPPEAHKTILSLVKKKE